MELKQTIERLAEQFEVWNASAGIPWAENDQIREACLYSLSSGGKRIRPVLALLVAEMLGVNQEDLRAFTLALEMIHTSSLIHDDLPALDNDSLRRGKPTCHVVYGEGTAVLAGDLLIARAFHVLASSSELSADIRLSWVAILSDATEQLCDGQAFDLEFESPEKRESFRRLSQEEKVNRVFICHRKKTAALFRAATLAPVALLPTEERGAVSPILGEFGEELGLLFQMTDDLLDAPNEDQGQAAPQGLSFVHVLGVAGTKELVRKKAEQLLGILQSFPARQSQLRELVLELAQRSR